MDAITTSFEADPVQIACVSMVLLILGEGFTVIVKLEAGPVHPFIEGITVIIAVFAAVVLLSAINAGTFPLPLAASPMEVLELVQVNVLPGMLLLKFETDTVLEAHTVKFSGLKAVGVGLMVIV